MICSPFDVVVVQFPFADRAASKMRPALVESSESFNQGHEQTILAMITTAARSSWPSDVEIMDPQGAGLRKRSIVRLKLFTIDNAMILQTIGQLSQPDRETVLRNLDDGLCRRPEERRP